jgi:hypothetical protein
MASFDGLHPSSEDRYDDSVLVYFIAVAGPLLCGSPWRAFHSARCSILLFRESVAYLTSRHRATINFKLYCIDLYLRHQAQSSFLAAPIGPSMDAPLTPPRWTILCSGQYQSVCISASVHHGSVCCACCTDQSIDSIRVSADVRTRVLPRCQRRS